MRGNRALLDGRLNRIVIVEQGLLLIWSECGENARQELGKYVPLLLVVGRVV
ncbi:MAG: hypothetical protein ACLR5T_07675 [Veillonella sp.]